MRRFRTFHVVPPLVVASLVLGYAGYGQIPASGLSVTDKIFSTLQLFSLNESVPATGTPWQLDIARFLAPLTVTLTAALTVLLLVGRELRQALRERTARDHVVVIDDRPDIAAALRKAGHQVVQLPGRPSDQRALEKARPDRARHVLILTDDDADNLELLARVNELPGRRSVSVRISSPELWRELGGVTLLPQPSRSVDYLHPADAAARALLDLADRVAPAGLDHVAIDGGTPTAQRLITHLARRMSLASKTLVIELVGIDAPRTHARLLHTEAWVLEAVDIRVTSESDCQLCFVCSDDDTLALARAVRALAETDGPVLVETQRATLGAGAKLLSPDGRLHLLARSEAQEGQGLLDGTGRELMAKARHEHYRRVEAGKGGSAATNSSLVPWSELPETLRRSNREFADAAGSVLARLGGVLVPLRGAPSPLALPGPVLEHLARQEHVRWMKSLLDDGWTATTGPKDARSREHPSLVAWDALSAEEQEKDRDAVRALPAMLSWLGYELRLPALQEDRDIT